MKRRDHLDKLGALLERVGLDPEDVLEEDQDGAFYDFSGRRMQLARLSRKAEQESDTDGQ